MYGRKANMFSHLMDANKEYGLEAVEVVTRPYEQQYYQKGNKVWYIKRLHELCKDLPVKTMKLDDLDMSHILTPRYTLPQLALHVKLVMNANLDYPILLGREGNVMDGRHRITLSIVRGMDEIRYQQFNEDPAPDYLTDD